MAKAYVYGSEYERLVLTTTHPNSAQFMKIDDPPNIASQRFPWLAIRWEELIVVAYLASVIAYCAMVYAGVYVATYPFQLIVGYSWDLILGSFFALRLHGRTLPRLPSRRAIAAMPLPEQEEAQRETKRAARAYSKRRNLALALCAVAALLRWYYGWGDVRVFLP